MELRKATEECTVTLTSRRVSITEDTRIGQGAMSRTCSFPTEEKERLGSLHASTSSSTSSFVSPRAPGPPPATVPGPLFITTSQCPAVRRANTTGHCVIRKKKKRPRIGGGRPTSLLEARPPCYAATRHRNAAARRSATTEGGNRLRRPHPGWWCGARGVRRRCPGSRRRRQATRLPRRKGVTRGPAWPSGCGWGAS